jgi:hypothetical protein
MQILIATCLLPDEGDHHLRALFVCRQKQICPLSLDIGHAIAQAPDLALIAGALEQNKQVGRGEQDQQCGQGDNEPPPSWSTSLFDDYCSCRRAPRRSG